MSDKETPILHEAAGRNLKGGETCGAGHDRCAQSKSEGLFRGWICQNTSHPGKPHCTEGTPIGEDCREELKGHHCGCCGAWIPGENTETGWGLCPDKCWEGKRSTYIDEDIPTTKIDPIALNPALPNGACREEGEAGGLSDEQIKVVETRLLKMAGIYDRPLWDRVFATIRDKDEIIENWMESCSESEIRVKELERENERLRENPWIRRASSQRPGQDSWQCRFCLAEQTSNSFGERSQGESHEASCALTPKAKETFDAD